MEDFKEFVLAIARILLGLIVLIGGLLVLDIIVYISSTSATSSEVVTAAFDDGYSEGYAQTYDVSYQEAHEKAYDKGYEKGYEIGLMSYSKEAVPTRVELHNPTYQELREFLALDKTDSKQFIKGEYVCFDFAAELNNNAEASGIRAAYVRIRAKEWGHAIVAFETTDRGLIFIDPQSDRSVDLVIGKPYQWDWIGAVRPEHYDDPIVEIQIIW